MRKITLFILTLLAIAPSAMAQTLSLDSCRAMALRSNKQMSLARAKQEVAKDARKAARTKYLPHVDVAGGYLYSSRSLSILNDDQKQILGSLGSFGTEAIGGHIHGITDAISKDMENGIKALAQKGLQKELAQELGNMAGQISSHFGQMSGEMMQQMAMMGDAMGQRLVDAFNTNTHHTFTASAMLTQPLYMGGAITAANNMADISVEMAQTGIEAKEHDVLFSIDNAYWTVVSLKHKQKLAEGYLELVQKLDDDVHKMIREGVATRADGLKVDVAVNEAEMTKTKVDNGLALSRMLLCQLCGMPLDSDVTLADENKEELELEPIADYDSENAIDRRPEVQLLEKTVELTKQQTKLAKAERLPQVAMTTGAVFTNPSLYNGFERKFKGAFNLGVMVRVPVLDWGESTYKIRATKGATNMAQIQLDEATELIELQINQCNFRVREANKNLITARKNIQRAEENLRCANIGFKEGVMQTTDVMAAQTAWMQAQTQKVDAEIDVKLSEVALRKALGLY